MDMILTSLEKSAQSITNVKRGKIGLCRKTVVDHNETTYALGNEGSCILMPFCLLAQNHKSITYFVSSLCCEISVLLNSS